MPRPRTPKAKAAITGRLAKDPARFKGRNEPKPLGTIGPAPEWMTSGQAAAWRQFAAELPWLTSSHRALVSIAATVRARLQAGENVGINALTLLRQCLGQMGATPADASRVAMPEDSEPDPLDHYFARPLQ